MKKDPTSPIVGAMLVAATIASTGVLDATVRSEDLRIARRDRADSKVVIDGGQRRLFHAPHPADPIVVSSNKLLHQEGNPQ